MATPEITCAFQRPRTWELFWWWKPLPRFQKPSPQIDSTRMNITCRPIDHEQLIASRRSACDSLWTGFTRIAGLFGAASCIVLALLGVFLPLLPTTLFVLLASYLICRSWSSMHRRFRKSRLFSRLLTDWEERGRIRQKTKSRAIAIVLTCTIATLYFGMLSETLTIMVVALVAVGLFVVLRLPVVRSAE